MYHYRFSKTKTEFMFGQLNTHWVACRKLIFWCLICIRAAVNVAILFVLVNFVEQVYNITSHIYYIYLGMQANNSTNRRFFFHNYTYGFFFRLFMKKIWGIVLNFDIPKLAQFFSRLFYYMPRQYSVPTDQNHSQTFFISHALCMWWNIFNTQNPENSVS